jgi:hypothetical protein
MARQVGAALEHLRRRRPIRPFAFHRDRFRAGPGKAVPADTDAVLDRLLTGQDIIQAPLGCRDNNCPRLVAAVPSNNPARDRLLAEDIEKIGERPAVERIKTRDYGSSLAIRIPSSTEKIPWSR